MARAEAGGQKTGQREVLSTQRKKCQQSRQCVPSRGADRREKQLVYGRPEAPASTTGSWIFAPLEREFPIKVMCTERDSTHSLVCSDRKMEKEAVDGSTP